MISIFLRQLKRCSCGTRVFIESLLSASHSLGSGKLGVPLLLGLTISERFSFNLYVTRRHIFKCKCPFKIYHFKHLSFHALGFPKGVHMSFTQIHRTAFLLHFMFVIIVLSDKNHWVAAKEHRRFSVLLLFTQK